MLRLFLIFCFIGFESSSQTNKEINATVVAVVDGNTIDIVDGSQERQRVVFSGIDCPELQQEFGEQAKRFVEKLVLNKKVTVKFQGKTKQGNYLAVVMLKDDDLRIELLKEGLAWTAEKNPLEELEPYRSWAQQKNRGLWKQENPTPPWVFRRQQSLSKPKSS